MNRHFWFLGALAALLSLSAPASRATDLSASVPATEHAARSKDVVDRAIAALVAREGESRISRLWVFPTAEANVVFVHYRTTSDVDAHEPGPTTEHLVLLEMSGERIAKWHDLTTAPATVVASVTGQ
jgi:hypothetical protein